MDKHVPISYKDQSKREQHVCGTVMKKSTARAHGLCQIVKVTINPTLNTHLRVCFFFPVFEMQVFVEL